MTIREKYDEYGHTPIAEVQSICCFALVCGSLLMVVQLLLATSALASSVVSLGNDHVVCLAKQDLETLSQAYISGGREDWINVYRNLNQRGRCFTLKKGIRGHHISGWLTYKVRVFLDSGDTLILYGPMEAWELR